MTQVSSDFRSFRGHGEKWSRKKDQAIVALLTEPTITTAAEKAGITPRTLYKWLQTSEFKSAYMQAKREAVSVAITRLQQAAMEAVDTLRMVMNDVNSPASVRVSAARTILEMSIKAMEMEDLEVRIEELERLITNKKEVI